MKRRDIELLSAYLDGELKPSDSVKLEARLKSDPELGSVLNDLRATRTLLRKLPSRKAPRNFTLTRQMVGQNPPLPRTYSVFRFATALATLLFIFSFGLNAVNSFVSQPQAFGIGGGGGGGGGVASESYATEAPAAEVPPAPPAAAQLAPTEATQPPSAALAAPATQAPAAEDSNSGLETQSQKGGPEANSLVQSQPQVPRAPLVSSQWQIVLAVIAVLGFVLMLIMRQIAASRWR